MNHPSSGWSFGWLLSCSIHSLMYGEQCRIETPANSHAFRKRTPSISTRSSSPRSNVTRAPPRSTSDFNSSRCSDRSCPLRQIRLSRLSATCLIFSVMDPCSEEQSNKCNNQPIRNFLQEWKLELRAVLNFQEFLSDEENTIGLNRSPQRISQPVGL